MVITRRTVVNETVVGDDMDIWVIVTLIHIWIAIIVMEELAVIISIIIIICYSRMNIGK